MILDNFGSICYNGDSSTDELATIGDTMTITILIQGAEVETEFLTDYISIYSLFSDDR